MASDDRTDGRRARFAGTLAALEEVIPERPEIPGAILRDSRIQRFEFTFEALWKLLQEVASAEGMDASSPRKALQAALVMGLVDPDDETTAWETIRYRNLAVHTYDEDLAVEVEAFVVGPALSLFRKVAGRI